MRGIWRRLLVLVTFLWCTHSQMPDTPASPTAENAYENLFKVDYVYNEQLLSQLRECDLEGRSCDEHLARLYTLSAKITNEHNALLLNDRAQLLFEDVLYFLGNSSPKLRAKICHVLSVVHFSNGNSKMVGEDCNIFIS